MTTAYRRAGVDIDAGNRAVELMRAAVRSTYGPEVLAGIGAFGGLYDAARLREVGQPVLVASTDGVGTKTHIAVALGRLEGLGQDIVNHCINDILVQGARPLFFLDYVAMARLDPEAVARIVAGCARACCEAGCALLGGETAEMPGVYAPGEIDLVGTIVGWVDRRRIIDGSTVEAGDVVLGLPSSGLHTNGYSLARQVFANVPWETVFPELGQPLGEVLLEPHRSYLSAIEALWAAGVEVKAMAHITGGGFLENIPRVLPAGMGVRLQAGAWEVPPVFALIRRLGGIDGREMFRVFNMGIGLVLVVPSVQAGRAVEALAGARAIGEVVPWSGSGERVALLSQEEWS